MVEAVKTEEQLREETRARRARQELKNLPLPINRFSRFFRVEQLFATGARGLGKGASLLWVSMKRILWRHQPRTRGTSTVSRVSALSTRSAKMLWAGASIWPRGNQHICNEYITDAINEWSSLANKFFLLNFSPVVVANISALPLSRLSINLVSLFANNNFFQLTIFPSFAALHYFHTRSAKNPGPLA